MLPQSFTERMQGLLGSEYEEFLASFEHEKYQALRLNPLKKDDMHIITEKVKQTFQLQPVPWAENGYYYTKEYQPGKHPWHEAGLYYIQEPSAMAPVTLLSPQPGERILDLCAAPGGKSTQIASAMEGEGLLVTNEIHPARAKILSENVERMGIRNACVLNETPEHLADIFEEYFDRILVDAPCSGEGMFRKDPKAISEWSEANLKLCSERQKRILSDIWDSLKPGGFLIYSTCTYNPGENEAILEWITEELEGTSIKMEHSFNTITPATSKAFGYHFYPHKTRGEGFFIGVMQKQEGTERTIRKNKKQNKAKPMPIPQALSSLLGHPEQFTAYVRENQIGFVPAAHYDFIGELENQLRVIYKGCEAIEMNNKKIKYLHPLALFSGLERTQCARYETDLNTALTYLKKEDIPTAGQNGEWLLLTHRNIALGWGKNLGNRLNNYYPKEWRIRMRLDAESSPLIEE